VMQNEIIRDVEFLGYSFDRKFIPSKLTWKQIIKEYEKGNREYI
jgi:hypothetical protein